MRRAHAAITVAFDPCSTATFPLSRSCTTPRDGLFPVCARYTCTCSSADVDCLRTIVCEFIAFQAARTPTSRSELGRLYSRFFYSSGIPTVYTSDHSAIEPPPGTARRHTAHRSQHLTFMLEPRFHEHRHMFTATKCSQTRKPFTETQKEYHNTERHNTYNTWLSRVSLLYRVEVMSSGCDALYHISI